MCAASCGEDADAIYGYNGIERWLRVDPKHSKVDTEASRYG